ncbi:MAG: 4-hydroxyphenylacetate-3-hydroxylase small chain [Sphingomonas bacterium]|nr:4-hydroxyphenylacetate-3-hydroxylase small chain [Sphingomonas bacterium]
MIEPEPFRTAMSRLGAAVNLVTTDGPAGRYGIVASALCSVTDAPPTILLCVNRLSCANAALKANGVLCANILAGRHQALSQHFATAPVAERFAAASWTMLETGAPLLTDAASALDCRVASVTEVGSHTVFFAEIVALRIDDDVDGLVWFDRRYHRLGAAAPSHAPEGSH